MQLAKTYDAGGAIPAYTLVKFSADFTVVICTGPTDRSIGVSTEVDTASGDRVDVIRDDLTFVKLGGTVAAGDPLTSDSNGNAVTSAPAATVTHAIIGYAETSGVAGDIIKMNVEPGYLSNAANS